jgi:hypothetical protein
MTDATTTSYSMALHSLFGSPTRKFLVKQLAPVCLAQRYDIEKRCNLRLGIEDRDLHCIAARLPCLRARSETSVK